MNKDVAKLDNALSKASLGSFETEEEFLRWVGTYLGTNVSQTCAARLQEARAKNKPISYDDILSEVSDSTRAVDFSKVRFRARFVW